PPGRAALEPHISLRYTSGKQNGIAGVGWSIDGLSAIARCPKIKGRDGLAAGVGDGNQFCLDGQRLVARRGQTYGADGTEYRTELDGITKIVQVGDTAPGRHSPDFFVAFTKTG